MWCGNLLINQNSLLCLANGFTDTQTYRKNEGSADRFLKQSLQFRLQAVALSVAKTHIDLDDDDEDGDDDAEK